jgi:predicted DCC family thiol-disulfide oxidoreductase YuxK
MNVPQDKKIILFDGVCNLCDGFVQFIIKKDTQDQFRFVALQSDLGKEITTHLKINTSKIDSVILYEPGIAYFYKSDAVFEIAHFLGGIFSLINVFKVLPLPLRNSLYDYIAANRYKWYGKKQSCMMPTAAIKAKFL